MNKLIRKHKYLMAFTILTILIGGCSNSKVSNKETSIEKSSISNNSSDVVSPNDNLEKDTSFKIKSGLLIGLSKDNELNKEVKPLERVPNSYRTLWIHQDNNKISYSEKKGEIITPYKDSFYKVGNSKFTMSTPNNAANNQLDNIYNNFNSYYNFSNIVSHLADKPMMDLFTTETFKKKFLNEGEGNMGLSYMSQIERLWYVGNNYACIMNYNYQTGGGTLRSGSNDFKMYDLTNLSSLDGRKKNVALADLLDKSEKVKLQGYSEKYNKIISSDKLVKEENQVDIKNIVLSRKDGKWQILIPLYDVYEHYGNSTTLRYVIKYINTDIKLPKAITSYDDLCIDWENIKEKIPEAKDAISSPNKDMLAVLTPTKLLIYADFKNGIDKPSLSIDVDSNESIILNQWCTGEYVDKWNKLISGY